MICTVIFGLVFTAPAKWRVELRAKIGQYRNRCSTDMKRLYELHDILTEIDAVKGQTKYRDISAYLDSSIGVKPIIQKLPHNLQEKWVTRAVKYKKMHDVLFPPFREFVSFIGEMSKIRNDPGLMFGYGPKVNQPGREPISVKKTEANASFPRRQIHKGMCLIHEGAKHSSSECNVFRKQSYQERLTLLKEHNVCFRCCDTSTHVKRRYKANVQCTVCRSKNHCTAIHVDRTASTSGDRSSVQSDGEESTVPKTKSVSTMCTDICGDFKGKSCAKILPVLVYPKGDRNSALSIYAVFDDQSNQALAKGELFDFLRIRSAHIPYELDTCSGKVMCYGRTADGLVVESIDGQTSMDLPTVLERDDIPENYSEIPTPEVASHYTHLHDLAQEFDPLDESRKILLLIGRDLIDAFVVLDQRTGPSNTPIGQKLPLGWTIIGDACLSRQHLPPVTGVYKTYISNGGRASVFEPCAQYMKVYPATPSKDSLEHMDGTAGKAHGTDLFECTPDDNKPGLSVEDRQFLTIMSEEMHLDDSGSLVAPLPSRVPRKPLPNNYSQALRRARSFDASLRRDSTKKEHFITFMNKLFANGHAELAPALPRDKERWYLPLFGVYHPHKPDQIRGVFDSSAKHEGISLNEELLSGPDLANNLLGVLLRFRREMVAVVADIQHMFHCFVVREDDRDFLRFLWHKDNSLDNELVEYRMRVHVFGNRPSPSIANYGLLRVAALAESSHGTEVKNFITNNFYVDDGLTSCSSSSEAISLLTLAQDALKTYGGLRLHKFASNDASVMRAFQPEDLAKDLINLDFQKDLPLQRSLGLVWNLKLDTFQFSISSELKPLSRRGVLSTVNSLYDPLGFLSPVTITGKIILRKIVSSTRDWDEPLPDDLAHEWNDWRTSLSAAEDIRIPRVVVPNPSDATRKELWVYSDASEQAISAVVYLRTLYQDGSSATGFLLGKSKVAPPSGHTIPRLELCAAVMAVDLSQIALEQLQIDVDDVKYFTDSRVVLGYISNEKKRFFTYVANRVAHIRSISEPDQWNYVNTHDNPADVGSRGISAADIAESLWLTGPAQSLSVAENTASTELDLPAPPDVYPLINPDEDAEVRCKTSHVVTDVRSSLGSHRFLRFSSWKSLVRAIALLQRFLMSRKDKEKKLDFSRKTVESLERAERFIIQCVQSEAFAKELVCLMADKPLPKDSHIVSLDPTLDEDSLMRVGGRLKRLSESSVFKTPVLIPGKHHIATLLARKCHLDVHHQGRHFTEGRVRSSGFWITGCKRLVSSLIHKCVMCRKLRGKLEVQKMSDLPSDRITPGQPPFTSVGIDIFGPWEVVTRRTRGGAANSKRWAALFTCLVTRAVHIEVFEEMSASSFINALRRFIALRGKVDIIRSDRGTNFVGSVNPLQINAINVEDGPVRDFLYNSGTTWIFNPPHSSHMGGVWERMIGTTRRILDSMLLEYGSRTLTHEVLATFLAEVTSIINSRPLVPVSSDAQSPIVLTLSILLTQKTDSEEAIVVPVDSDPKDLLRKQWKRVQHLAAVFWKRWRGEYLQTLQTRRKWFDKKRNLSEGDVVLLKEKDAARNDWPLGVVLRAMPSLDGCVRKAEVRVVRGERSTSYVRPVTEIVVLLENQA